MTDDPSPQKQQPSAMPVFFSLVLMAVGGMMVALCGSCTFVFLGQMALSAITYPRSVADSGAAFYVILILAVGGIPTAIGVLIFRSGWMGYRQRRSR